MWERVEDVQTRSWAGSAGKNPTVIPREARLPDIF
jgi:hypothetical protein